MEDGVSVLMRRPATLAEVFSPRANSIGFLRLALATALLIAHSWPVGFGQHNLGYGHTGGQTDVGTLALYGFFVVSGFLITASGLRFRLHRFAWHRFLRIFPGLWVCLLVTALVIAPLVAEYEHGSLAGFWQNNESPLHYLEANWWTNQRQFGISHLLENTPHGRSTGASVFNGALWSLVYELCCYLLIGVLAVTAILKRAKGVVLTLTVALYLVIFADFLTEPGDFLSKHPLSRGVIGPLPLLGNLNVDFLLYLGMVFLLGACAQLFKDRLLIHPLLAGVAAVVFFGSLIFGGFFVFGIPAYAYLLLFVACYLPPRFQGIGRTRDYSYGIYIYAFPVQQVVALLHGNRWGVGPYIVLSLLGTLVFAIPSWHLVERPAMALKNWTPSRLRRRPPWQTGPAMSDVTGSGVPAPADGAPADVTSRDGVASSGADAAAAPAPQVPPRHSVRSAP
jgi:peptidoglycan/LPS O-acetylase OafA/YrhL